MPKFSITEKLAEFEEKFGVYGGTECDLCGHNHTHWLSGNVKDWREVYGSRIRAFLREAIEEALESVKVEGKKEEDDAGTPQRYTRGGYNAAAEEVERRIREIKS